MTHRRLHAAALVAALLILHASAGSQSKFLRHFGLAGTASTTGTLPPSNSISQSVMTPESLWIGTSKGAASSIDLGRHWTSYRGDPAFAHDGIYSLSVSGPLVWASTGYDKETNDGSVQTGSGYAVSTDNGATWHRVAQALDRRGDSIIAYGINDSLRILPVTVPEQSVTFDAAISPHAVWVAGWASGLRKTTDLGATWERILLPSDIESSLSDTDTLWRYAATDTLRLHRIFPRYDPRKANNYLAFSVLAIDDSLLWCGTAGGVNRTTDGGRSWQKFSHQNEASPILGNWVIAISRQRTLTLNRIWTTNWKADDLSEDYGVSYTDDDGASWKTLLHGVKAYGFAFNATSGAVYIASDDGIYRTTDNGATFTLNSSISDPANHQTIVRPSVYTIAVKGDTVIAGTSDGLARTVDAPNQPFGQNWTVERAYVPLASTGDSYAYPNPFSPRFQAARLHYAVGAGAAASVTIELYDFGMNRVRTLLHDAPRAAGREYDELWDGRREDGSAVANGVYIYRITVDNNDPLFGKILVLQ